MNRRLPISLTILPTYQCTAACHDCCFASNPGVKGRVSLENILKYIDQAAEMKTIELVVFSGGEAFLLGDDLDVAIRHANSKGLLTRIVTNAYWATSIETAQKRLSKLKEAGLTELNASTGDYHQEFVPIKNVINATIASLSLGMPMCIMVESREGRKFSKKNIYSDEKLALVLKDPAKKKIFHLVESPWIGNYDNESVKQSESVYLNRNNLQFRRGCDSVLANIVVTPYEKLGACCGLPREQIPELNVGSLKENTVQELYDEALGDFMKIWLFVEGPEHILAWAATKDPSIDWENKYSHQCDSCRALYHEPKIKKVIMKYYHEKIPDVMFRFSIIDKGRIMMAWSDRSRG